MRTDYLYKVASVTADASGSVIATLKPDVNQYWTPRFIRVTMDPQSFPRTNVSPVSLSLGTVICQLYLGNTSLPAGNGYIVDVTCNGFADTSGIISGSTLQYGDTISAKWLFVAPGTQCTMELIGMSSDTPPSYGDSTPLLMGPPFRHQLAEPDVTVDVVPISFLNPGQNNSAIILDPAASSAGVSIYLMELHWTWVTSVINCGGDFVDGVGSVIVHDMATITFPQNVNFRGGLNNEALLLSGSGLEWKQTGTAAASSTRCVGTAVVYGTGLF